MDPAQESLSDALKVSFFLLKLVMLVLVAWYLLSGLFNVQEQEAAVRLRFGNIVGEAADTQVLRPGGPYFSAPFPIDQIIKVRTSPRTLKLEQDFFLQIPETERGKSLDELAQRGAQPLNAARDSYLVTGDANIVHARWDVEYNVGGRADDPGYAGNVIQWIANLGDEAIEQEIVRAAARQGIVRVTATLTADALINGLSPANLARIKSVIQDTLNELECGLVVTKVTSYDPLVPLSIRRAFNEVSDAETKRGREVEKAQKQRAEILNSVAGPAHQQLWRIIQKYQVAFEASDDAAAQHLQEQLDEMFEHLNTGESYGSIDIEGEVAGIINEARTYRTRISQELEAEADTFDSLLKQYELTPRLVATREWERVKQSVLGGRVRIFYTPAGSNVVIQANPDPRQTKAWEKEDLEAEDVKKKEAAAP